MKRDTAKKLLRNGLKLYETIWMMVVVVVMVMMMMDSLVLVRNLSKSLSMTFEWFQTFVTLVCNLIWIC